MIARDHASNEMWEGPYDAGADRPDEGRFAGLFHAIEDLRVFAESGPQLERRAALERIAKAAGIQDLWSFAVVEDDLFLRDCVGAVPGRREIAAVIDALENGPGSPTQAIVRGRRLLVFGSVRTAKPVVAGAFDPGRKQPDPHGMELLACLVEVLAADEAGAEPDECAAPARIRRHLDDLAARIIRETLDRSGHDRGAASAELGVTEKELMRRASRLGVSTLGRREGSAAP